MLALSEQSAFFRGAVLFICAARCETAHECRYLRGSSTAHTVSSPTNVSTHLRVVVLLVPRVPPRHLSNHEFAVPCTLLRVSRHTRTLALGAIPVIVLALLLTIPKIPGTDISLAVPYAAEGPGPTFNTLGDVDGTPVVDIKGAPLDSTTGNLNMTTVAVTTGMTLPQLIGLWAFSDASIVPLDQVIPQHLTQEEVDTRNKEEFTNSEALATMAALRYLDLPLGVTVAEVMPDSPAEDELRKGDTIRAVNGTEVTEPQEVQKIVQEAKPRSTITLTVVRDKRSVKVPIQVEANPQNKKSSYIGVYLTSSSATGIDVHFNLNEVGGPSAGLIFALAVIDKLSPGQLNGGKFVAGSGTIDESGKVGPIGGIEHKVAAAHSAGAQLFLSPAQNCSEAVGKEHGDMKIVSVSTLHDAIAQMEAFSKGKPLKTCQQN